MKSKIINFLKRLKIIKPNFIFIDKYTSLEQLKQESKKYKKKIIHYANEDFDTGKSIEIKTPLDVNIHDNKYIIHELSKIVNENKFSILEIGGGSNPIYSFLKQNSDINIDSYVLERKEFVKIIDKQVNQKFGDKLKYVSSIDDLELKNFDLLYFGSSLQYFHEFYDFMKLIFLNNVTYIAITNTLFNLENNDYYIIQANIKDVLLPYKFFSEKKIINFFELNDYECVYNKDIRHSYTHNSLKNSELILKDFIFKKK